MDLKVSFISTSNREIHNTKFRFLTTLLMYFDVFNTIIMSQKVSPNLSGICYFIHWDTVCPGGSVPSSPEGSDSDHHA